MQGLMEVEEEEALHPDITAKLSGIELERNQTEDQTDGLTITVDDKPKPDFEELTVGALENADVFPGNHIRDQPDEALVKSSEVVYYIEINLPDAMTPVAVNNDRLASNGRAVMVQDMDDKDKFDNEDEAGAVTAAPILLQLPHVPHPGLAAMAPRPGLRSCRSGVENQPYNAYLNPNIKKPNEGTVLIDYVHTGAG